MDQDTTCPYCNERPLGKRKGSKTCGDKACQQARNRETNKIAYDADPALRGARARARRESQRTEKACPVCDRTFLATAKQVYCSSACGNVGRAGDIEAHRARKDAEARAMEARRAKREARRASRVCTHCGASIADAKPGARTCSMECREARLSVLRAKSPLRQAWESRDLDAWCAALHGLTSKTVGGCWEWQGRASRGYGTVKFDKRQVAVHRASLEMRLGRGLGSEAAHHMCANSMCVNPEHLQPISARENTAEMIQRNYFLARIAELEAEVARLDPSSPLLTENLPMSA